MKNEQIRRDTEGLHQAPSWKALGGGITGVRSYVPSETPLPVPMEEGEDFRPELHFLLAQGKGHFRIQTNDGALRTFVALGGVVQYLPITVYYDPVDEDACEVFAAMTSMDRAGSMAKLPLGCGVLAAMERRDGSRETDLVLPEQLNATAWLPVIERPGLHYAKDADDRIALGYEMRATRFHVVNGPQDIVPVLFQPACPRGSRALGRSAAKAAAPWKDGAEGAQGKGGAE